MAMKYSVLAGILHCLLLSFLDQCLLFYLLNCAGQEDQFIVNPPFSSSLSGFGDVDDIGPGLHLVELCAGSHRLSTIALEYHLKSLAMDASNLRLFWESYIDPTKNQYSDRPNGKLLLSRLRIC